jgi:hypothetical protein
MPILLMMTEFYILVGDINTSCDTGRQVVKLYSTKPGIMGTYSLINKKLTVN